MKKFIAALILGLIVIGMLVVGVWCQIKGDYRYEAEILSSWNLADKSSTIAQKAIYVDQFVVSLERQGLSGKHNAVLFPTPDNSFDANLLALKTLQQRLQEIQTMNPSSFEYQTAMQQITAQEQGEAHAMLDVFYGVWFKQNYPFLWDWIGALYVCLGVVLGIVATGLFLMWCHDD